ncbi:MAG TPA: sugar transferase, partial [Planctomycetota bacterium]|nr:sugar transferase [Planctomycetota bacterium]
MRTLRVLFLCQRVPFPPNRGDRIATHRRLLHLASRHEVTCLTFATDPGDPESIAKLAKQGVRVVADSFPGFVRRAAALPWLATRTPLTLPCF